MQRRGILRALLDRHEPEHARGLHDVPPLAFEVLHDALIDQPGLELVVDAGRRDDGRRELRTEAIGQRAQRLAHAGELDHDLCRCRRELAVVGGSPPCVLERGDCAAQRFDVESAEHRRHRRQLPPELSHECQHGGIAGPAMRQHLEQRTTHDLRHPIELEDIPAGHYTPAHMREVALVAVTVLASACHHEQEGERASTPSPAPQRRSRLPPPQRISLVRTPIEREAWLSSLGRGSSGRAAATHFLHVDITADPALGMNVRFLNVEGEPEFRCTPRGALYLDHHRSCFLAGTCPAMVKQVTGFEWDLADLVEIMNGGAPHVAAPGEKLVGQVTEVGCNVMSTKAPLHSWRVKHQFKFAAAPPEPCPAPYEISYSVVELPYSDENNSVSFDWGDRRPLQMDPARVELSPPAGYVTCPPRSP